MSKLNNKDDVSVKTVSNKKELQIKKTFSNISKFLMELYVLFYLCIFPLCTHEKYFDILSFRFQLFWKPTVGYGIVFAVLGIFYLLSDNLYNAGRIRKKFFESLKNKGWKKYISSTDAAMIALIIVFSLSTAFAEYPYEAFWGNRGRSQGLFLWLMFFIAYLLVTRFYEFKKWHIYAYMAGAGAVCVWGILNFFLFTFGMFEGADPIFKYTFVSSIGNINCYTGFTGILYGVSAVMFILADNNIEIIFSYTTLMIASFAQIMGLSDNAILSTGIVLALSPILLLKSWKQVFKYLISATTYLLAIKITSIITMSGVETMNDLDPSPQITMGGSFCFNIALLVVMIITVIVFIYSKKTSIDDSIVKSIPKWWTMFMGMIILVIVSALIMANVGIKEELWLPIKNFVIFNDDWGTGRGLAWRLGMEYWINDSTWLSKIIGYGPDTYYIITMDRFMNIMQDAGYGIFDSAHNEYFEYFITVGIIGLATYVIFLVTALKKMIVSEVSWVKAAAFGTIAYATQAIVNIAIPITTPVFMILMYAGISGAMAENRGKKEDY